MYKSVSLDSCFAHTDSFVKGHHVIECKLVIKHVTALPTTRRENNTRGYNRSSYVDQELRTGERERERETSNEYIFSLFILNYT